MVDTDRFNRKGSEGTMSERNCIEVGDRVRVEFWPMKNDLCGDVISVPTQPFEPWIIRTEDRLHYVQHYATISRRDGEQ